MEYQNQLNTPVAKQVKKRDPHTTLFVGKNGEFIELPTEEQAKAKVKNLLKVFNPEDWWAQSISRFRLGKDDYFTAYIVRDFSKDHSRSDFANRSDKEMWIGRIEIGIPSRTTDTDETSDTHGERIPETMTCELADKSVADVPVLEKRGYYSYHKVTKETIAFYKKMCGMTMDDKETQYVFVLKKGGRNVQAEDPEDFWNTTVDDKVIEDRKLIKARRAKELTNEPPKNAR